MSNLFKCAIIRAFRTVYQAIAGFCIVSMIFSFSKNITYDYSFGLKFVVLGALMAGLISLAEGVIVGLPEADDSGGDKNA